MAVSPGRGIPCSCRVDRVAEPRGACQGFYHRRNHDRAALVAGTPSGAKVASGYFTIKNASDAPDRLLSVTADIAERTGIHQMSMSDGVMQMRELTDGLAIPAAGSVTLGPASYHLMFEDLKRPLKEGETFSGTLTFEQAGRVSVTFDVKGLGASSP